MTTIIPPPAELSGALAIGLLASTHCLAMCGGVSAAFGMATAERQGLLVSLFSVGRVACYSLLGLLAGSLSQWLGSHYLPLVSTMRVLAGVLLIAIAGYVGQWWLGLRRLEAFGQRLWQRLSPLAQRLVPIRSPAQALSLGVLWGFLPCGLIYSTLLWASMQSSSAIGSALLMACFGLGTLPAMVGVGMLGQRGRQLLSGTFFRRGASLIILIFGVWTIAAVALMSHAGHGDEQRGRTGDHAVHSGHQNL